MKNDPKRPGASTTNVVSLSDRWARERQERSDKYGRGSRQFIRPIDSGVWNDHHNKARLRSFILSLFGTAMPPELRDLGLREVKLGRMELGAMLALVQLQPSTRDPITKASIQNALGASERHVIRVVNRLARCGIVVTLPLPKGCVRGVNLALEPRIQCWDLQLLERLRRGDSGAR